MAIPTYIVGTGGLGRGVAETVKIIARRDRNWVLAGFIDDNKEVIGKEIDGTPIIGDSDFLLSVEKAANVIIAIANPKIKLKIHEKLSQNPNLLYPNVINPSVNLNPSIIIGMGNIISDNVAFSSQVFVGNFSLIHFNCTIGHDVRVEDYVTIYPNASISGFSILDKKSEIGTNSSILAQVRIGENAVVGAGSMVNRNVEKDVTVVGVPARPIKK